MPYVHLANGDVETLDQEQMNEAFGDGSPIAYNKGGTQYAVIGVYPDGVKVEDDEPKPEPTSAKTGGTEDYRKGHK